VAAGAGAGAAVTCSAAGCCCCCCSVVVVSVSAPGLCASSLTLRAVVPSAASGTTGSGCLTAGGAVSAVGTDTGTGIGSSASEFASFFASGGVVVIRSREVYAKGK